MLFVEAGLVPFSTGVGLGGDKLANATIRELVSEPRLQCTRSEYTVAGVFSRYRYG
jgi:hypothetical protein